MKILLCALVLTGCGSIDQLEAEAKKDAQPQPTPTAVPTALPSASRAVPAPIATPMATPYVNVTVTESGEITPVTITIGEPASVQHHDELIACPPNAIGAIWDYVVLQRNDASSPWKVVGPQGFQVNAIDFERALMREGIPQRDLHITQQLDDGCVMDD